MNDPKIKHLPPYNLNVTLLLSRNYWLNQLRTLAIERHLKWIFTVAVILPALGRVLMAPQSSFQATSKHSLPSPISRWFEKTWNASYKDGGWTNNLKNHSIITIQNAQRSPYPIIRALIRQDFVCLNVTMPIAQYTILKKGGYLKRVIAFLDDWYT